MLDWPLFLLGSEAASESGIWLKSMLTLPKKDITSSVKIPANSVAAAGSSGSIEFKILGFSFSSSHCLRNLEFPPTSSEALTKGKHPLFSSIWEAIPRGSAVTVMPCDPNNFLL